MTFMQKMFSFEGRLRRQDFWICSIVLIVVSFVLNIIVTMIATAMGFGAAGLASSDEAAGAAAAVAALGAASLGWGIVCLLMVWPAFAVTVKRGHDRDQTGWLSLICLIPLVGAIFGLINYGILDGTPGPNKYGPSPKGLGGEEVVTV